MLGVRLISFLQLSSGRDLMLRLIGDNPNIPILVNARQFVTVCTKRPSNWRAIIDDNGSFHLMPESWSKPGFWESYFNGERAAEQRFIEELRKIETDESYPLLA